MVQTLTTNQMKQKVRDGQVITENNQPESRTYKGVFFGKNFHLYRHVNEGRGYRGDLYKTSGWVLSFSEVEEFSDNAPPTFVEDGAPLDSCKTCELAFPTGLDDKPKKNHVWCASAQAWMKEDGYCGCYKYDRELPSREG